MKTKEEIAISFLNQSENNAKRLLGNKGEMENLIKYIDVRVQIYIKSDIYTSLTEVPILISLVRDYTNGRYTEISYNNMIKITSVLLDIFYMIYYVPVDNYTKPLRDGDMTTVLVYVSELLHSDLEKYKKWKQEGEKYMNTNITDKQAATALKQNEGKAKELLKNKDDMEKFLEKLEKKISILGGIPVIGPAFADIPTLISLVRAYINGIYTEIPFMSIVAIVGALIYFVSPIDLIPDVIPVAGLIDDAAVLGIALKAVHSDLDDYREWKAEYYEK